MQLSPELERQSLVGRVAQQRVAKAQVPVGLLVEQFVQPGQRRGIGRRTVLLGVEPGQHPRVERHTEHRDATNQRAIVRRQRVDPRHRGGFRGLRQVRGAAGFDRRCATGRAGTADCRRTASRRRRGRAAAADSARSPAGPGAAHPAARSASNRSGPPRAPRSPRIRCSTDGARWRRATAVRQGRRSDAPGARPRPRPCGARRRSRPAACRAPRLRGTARRFRAASCGDSFPPASQDLGRGGDFDVEHGGEQRQPRREVGRLGRHLGANALLDRRVGRIPAEFVASRAAARATRRTGSTTCRPRRWRAASGIRRPRRAALRAAGSCRSRRLPRPRSGGPRLRARS